MLKLDLHRLFYERGIENPNQFLKQFGIPYRTTTRLMSHQLNSISFKHLETICLQLQCTVDDLFTWTPNNNLHNNHPLSKLKRQRPKESVTSKLGGLTLEKLDQVRNFINELENPKTDSST